MGLQRVNTAYFEVVNTSDPDVSGSDGHGENEWVAVSDAIVGPDATRLRIRALTRREIDGVPFGEDGSCLECWSTWAFTRTTRPLSAVPSPFRGIFSAH